ncbi:MAG: hypothetical protein IPJ58_18975 [Ardenticatenia bacterium]|nr:hypothetical protein [Ardenticatenia bacterium]MBK8539970.1 hypothetical protein [Ardenticatenia bacterium]
MPPLARNSQGVAWTVLLASFGVFLLLVIGGPFAVLRYLRSATKVPAVQVEAVRGALQVSHGVEEGVLLPGDGERKLAEGWAVLSADAASEAFISIADGDGGDDQPGTVISLQPQTQLMLERLRRPRFVLGRGMPELDLTARATQPFAGGLTVSSAWGLRKVRIRAQDPAGIALGELDLAPDSRARLDFMAEGAFRVMGQRGVVTVTNAVGKVLLGPQERSLIRRGAAPDAPQTGPQNVVRNDGFDNDLRPDTWAFGQRLPDRPVDVGRAYRTTSEGPSGSDRRSVIRFERRAAAGSSADLFFQQRLRLDPPSGEMADPTAADGDLDVRRAQFIGISAVLRVLEQSLPGGGELDSEYPLILRLRSVDRAAQNQDGCEWMVGFYAVPAPPGAQAPKKGVLVTPGEWHAFQSGNLLELGNPQGFADRGCPVPTHLIRIEVGTSGHDYLSEIDQLAVWVE